MPGAGGPGDVSVAGQCMQHDDDVVAGRRQLAPPLHGDADIIDHHTAFQRQRADIDDADFTLGGQRLGRHI